MFYFKFHIGDYRTDTQHLTLLEHGVYMTLMATYYSTEKPLPKDERQLFRLAGARTDEEKQAVIDVVNEFFNPTETHWVNSRIDFELKEYQSKADANRENGKKGGRPRKNAPQKPINNPSGFDSLKNKTQVDSETKPSDNPNITLTNKPTNPLTNEPIINIGTSGKPKRVTKKQKAINALIEMGVGKESASAIIEKRKGDEFTKLAIDEITLQAEAVNLSFVQAIEFAAKQEWRSFRADWYESRMRQQNNNRGTDNFHDQFYGVGQSPFGQQQNNQMRDVGNVLEIPYEEKRF